MIQPYALTLRLRPWRPSFVRNTVDRVLVEFIPPIPYSNIRFGGSYLSRSFSSSRYQISTSSLRRWFSFLKRYKQCCIETYPFQYVSVETETD